MGFGCVWLCHRYLILENLRDEINEFLGPEIARSLACFRLWVTLVCAVGFCYVLRYCKVVHSEKNQLQEQYATALMVQFCFSEVE